jgi:hypothetical protein
LPFARLLEAAFLAIAGAWIRFKCILTIWTKFLSHSLLLLLSGTRKEFEKNEEEMLTIVGIHHYVERK